jgi:hypothetical protein
MSPFNSLISDIKVAQSLVSELDRQRDMLSVQHMLFQNTEFKIYGTKDEPLFLVNDIICDLLGMDRPTDNRFFRDSRENNAYVNLCQFATSPPEL